MSSCREENEQKHGHTHGHGHSHGGGGHGHSHDCSGHGVDGSGNTLYPFIDKDNVRLNILKLKTNHYGFMFVNFPSSACSPLLVVLGYVLERGGSWNGEGRY